MIMKNSKDPQLHERFGKVFALVAASLILTSLAYADNDNDRSIHWRGDNDEHHGSGGERKEDPRISAVPEANAGWVLVPFMGAVLLFWARKFIREKTNE
jgi:hypothetical protein